MGEDLFNLDNILSGDEAASLFMDIPGKTEDSVTSPGNDNENKETKNDKPDITEVKSSEDIFGTSSESVGNELSQSKEGTVSTKDDDSPNKPNFYSSITDALVDDGVFPDLSEERIKAVVTPEDFRALIEERIQSELNDRQKRIDDALNSGVEPSVIKQYESTLDFLNRITPELLAEEGERGDDIRKRILMLDFLNKNFSLENATKMIKVLMDSGEDIEQAKQALYENKKFFSEKYKNILDTAKANEQAFKQNRLKQAEQLKNDIMTAEKVFGDVSIDKATRLKVFDNISKPIYKDSKTGELYTALQKYRLDNENDFIKNVGLLFTLTDGFKDLSKLVKASAKKEVKRKIHELENTLNNSSRNDGGSFEYVGAAQNEVGKSFLDRGYTLDI